jgi:hypothetical protein
MRGKKIIEQIRRKAKSYREIRKKVDEAHSKLVSTWKLENPKKEAIKAAYDLSKIINDKVWISINDVREILEELEYKVVELCLIVDGIKPQQKIFPEDLKLIDNLVTQLKEMLE